MKLKQSVVIGIVGGSDMVKQVEQMGGEDGECDAPGYISNYVPVTTIFASSDTIV